MAIDKSWTKLRNRACDAYWIGLQNFMNMASQYKDCDGRIRCPCVRCMNLRLQTLDVVQAHIFDRGFHQSYEQWIYHGEVEEDVDDEGVDENEPMDEMRDIVDDFLLPNNAEEANSGIGQYYDELFDEIKTELYPGCDWKSKRHAHFKKFYKGPDDWDEVLKNPPKDVNADEWKQICEFFRSPKFIARSVKNKINRDQVKYSTTQGTKSLAVTCHEKVKLKSTLEAETQQTVESGTDDSSSIDQMKILSKVLGEGRGHQRGVGRKLKRKSLTRPSQRSQSQAPPQQSTEEIRELVDILKVMNEQLQHVYQQLPPEKRPAKDVEMQNTYQRFFEKYVGSSSKTQTQHMSQALAFQPSPGHPNTSAPILPSQPSAQPYMYQWSMPPYPQAYHPHMSRPSSQLPHPHMSGLLSQPPSYPYPYPYIYGPKGSSLPLQYPWSMPPHTPQAPPPLQAPPPPQALEEGDNTDNAEG
ncbi:uncharacterized protein LOC133824334 [Humulus lupulus]|uniref:uncharacterized protein LOC133824334 n=1 Tax=Humulus lupulus TaxID=3486 RepID=UPI002B402D81|nr:uncharacterized protein LOC133824334 [Humulus lupulus]XP_062113198.1 uncharacterized protein LOC133824334 [Humulus lupulus]XP_062113199.1 uncharacterized protein LOC133824334 [Humulus lupulus]XP_062113200.1 uncharacterized protein LOC133824334 [Humulus lupulus]